MLVFRAWTYDANSSPLHAISHCVSRNRHTLLAWRTSGLFFLEQEIHSVKADIAQLENLDSSVGLDPSQSLILHSLINRYSALLGQLSIKWPQCAKLLWINNGDQNSKFFHRIARIHDHRNKFHRFCLILVRCVLILWIWLTALLSSILLCGLPLLPFLKIILLEFFFMT